ncbi:hypothetical protein J6590_082796 [Homalodisca vitripennis]|nr:hypothetical protein J6590_082796 [Homalodisca vitripennis]
MENPSKERKSRWYRRFCLETVMVMKIPRIERKSRYYQSCLGSGMIIKIFRENIQMIPGVLSQTLAFESSQHKHGFHIRHMEVPIFDSPWHHTRLGHWIVLAFSEGLRSSTIPNLWRFLTQRFLAFGNFQSLEFPGLQNTTEICMY